MDVHRHIGMQLNLDRSRRPGAGHPVQIPWDAKKNGFGLTLGARLAIGVSGIQQFPSGREMIRLMAELEIGFFVRRKSQPVHGA